MIVMNQQDHGGGKKLNIMNNNIFQDINDLKKSLKNYIALKSDLRYESDDECTIIFSMKKNVESKKREYGYLDYTDALILQKDIESTFSLIDKIIVSDVDEWIIFKILLKESNVSFIWKTHNSRYITSNNRAEETILNNFLYISLYFNKFTNNLYSKEEIIDKLTRMRNFEEWLITTPDDYGNIDENYHTIQKRVNN